MPKRYLNNHPKEEAVSGILPSSSPKQMNDWVDRHNKNFPKDPIKFDYNKFKN